MSDTFTFNINRMKCKFLHRLANIDLLLFTLLHLIAINNAFSTQYYGNTKHTELPEHCYYEDLDLAVPLNQTLYPTDVEYVCAAVSCREDYVLVIKHCDRILLRRDCTELSSDYTKPYPDCCPKVVCLQE